MNFVIMVIATRSCMSKKLYKIDLLPLADPSNEIIHPRSILNRADVYYGILVDLGSMGVYSYNKKALAKFWWEVKQSLISDCQECMVDRLVSVYDRDRDKINSLFNQPIHEVCNESH